MQLDERGRDFPEVPSSKSKSDSKEVSLPFQLENSVRPHLNDILSRIAPTAFLCCSVERPSPRPNSFCSLSSALLHPHLRRFPTQAHRGEFSPSNIRGPTKTSFDSVQSIPSHEHIVLPLLQSFWEGTNVRTTAPNVKCEPQAALPPTFL
jgi:hypothetical protein